MSVDDQYMNPQGEDGLKAIEEMYKEHPPLLKWAIGNLEADPKRILDVGCGGGIALRFLLEKYPEATAVGLDISEQSLDACRDYCKEFVDAGRLELVRGEVSHLPFKDCSFDLAVATSTYFFWPDVEHDVQEVASKIRSGGTMMLTGAFSDGTDEATLKEYSDRYHMTVVSKEQMASYFKAGGLSASYDSKEDVTAFYGTKN